MKKGSHLTDEVKAKISQSVKARIADGSFNPHYNEIPMRSREEYLFAEWLDSQGIAWEYQPIVFKMPDGFNYIPDFRIVETNVFVEVKKDLSENSGRCAEKTQAFIDAGNVLLIVAQPFDEIICNSILGRSALVRETFVTLE
jgi:hypothetical protein